MKEYAPLGLENLRILGRHSQEAPLRFLWSASGVEFDLRGSELWAELEADYTIYEPWISLTLNGCMVLRQPLQKGRHCLPLLRGLDATKPHHIQLLRESQAMPSDPDCLVALHSLRFDGELAPLPEPSCRIEVLGDSLTSAEGALGSPKDTEWLPTWFTGSMGYPQLLARKMNAEVRVISQSGWGVRSSWDNDPKGNIPLYYSQICGVVPGEKGGCAAPNDFAAWKPNVIVNLLGSNDSGAMNQPPRIDPITGEAFKQSANDTKPLEDAMLAFLYDLRRLNPDATLLWAFFLGNSLIWPCVQRAMARFQLATGDRNCDAFTVAPMRPTGVRHHPAISEHEALAQALAYAVGKALHLEMSQQ